MSFHQMVAQVPARPACWQGLLRRIVRQLQWQLHTRGWLRVAAWRCVRLLLPRYSRGQSAVLEPR